MSCNFATTVASRSLAAAGLLLAMVLTASAQSNCQWYGTTALKQQQQNQAMKCGFSGPEWSSDLGKHVAWCGSVPPAVWKDSAQKRDKMLAECAAKKG